MNKALYITNIEVPYKVRFFNELAKYCDLTVLYERERSNNRNSHWANSEKKLYDVKYLNGIKILRYAFGKYDEVVISCFNSPCQIFASLFLRKKRTLKRSFWYKAQKWVLKEYNCDRVVNSLLNTRYVLMTKMLIYSESMVVL